MKASTSMHNPVFFNSTNPALASWDETRQRISRQSRKVSGSPLTTDDLAASKQEIICCVILALCLLYTMGHVVVQLAA